jgi:hypothetical protein
MPVVNDLRGSFRSVVLKYIHDNHKGLIPLYDEYTDKKIMSIGGYWKKK